MFLFLEWCTILSLEDNITHTINSKELETETCEFVTDCDLYEGNEKYKGVPYTVEVKAVLIAIYPFQFFCVLFF